MLLLFLIQNLLVSHLNNIQMTQNIENKLKYLDKLNFTKKEKIEFIEKLYKLANVSFTEYIKIWQTNTNK